jgi:putative hydrolase of the HAD superfamily
VIKAILFDLDDTLLDRTASLICFIRDHFQRYGLDHLPYDTYQARFLELDQRGYAPKPWMFQSLIDEFALPAAVGTLLADFQDGAWHSCTLLPGARDVLLALRSRGYRIGVITNGEDWSQMRKLRATGLLPLVDQVLISEHERVKKPDPAIFLRAAERLAVGAGECMFVGDHPRNDIYGAGAVGMRTVWYPGDQTWPAHLAAVPDHTIQGLTELLALDLSVGLPASKSADVA